MTRVAHLILRGRQSGAETLAAELCRRQAAAGDEVHLLGLQAGEDDYRRLAAALPGVSWHEAPAAIGRIGRWCWLRHRLQAIAPRVVFAHSVIPAAYARTLFVQAPYRCVSVLHAANCNDYWGPGRLETCLQRRSDLILGVAAEGVANYRRHFGQGRPSWHLPNGIDLERVVAAGSRRQAVRTAFGVGDDEAVIIQVGRIDPVKGQRLSLQAVAGLPEAGRRRLQVWMIGGSEVADYTAAMQADLAALPPGITGRWLGARADVFDLLAAADCYLMPSSQEAHSVALLEALASGIPVFAADIATFQSYADLPGVELLPREATGRWTERIAASLTVGKRHRRDLAAWSIARTAARYRAVTRLLASLPRPDRATAWRRAPAMRRAMRSASASSVRRRQRRRISA